MILLLFSCPETDSECAYSEKCDSYIIMLSVERERKKKKTASARTTTGLRLAVHIARSKSIVIRLYVRVASVCARHVFECWRCIELTRARAGRRSCEVRAQVFETRADAYTTECVA